MNIIHIRKDGTVTDSIEGMIPNGEFYQVLQGILEKRKKVRREAIKKTH